MQFGIIHCFKKIMVLLNKIIKLIKRNIISLDMKTGLFFEIPKEYPMYSKLEKHVYTGQEILTKAQNFIRRQKIQI